MTTAVSIMLWGVFRRPARALGGQQAVTIYGHMAGYGHARTFLEKSRANLFPGIGRAHRPLGLLSVNFSNVWSGASSTPLITSASKDWPSSTNSSTLYEPCLRDA
jgi:hypothetical protein